MSIKSFIASWYDGIKVNRIVNKLTSYEFIFLKRSDDISDSLINFNVIMKILESNTPDMRKGFFDRNSHLFDLLTVKKITVVYMFFENHIFCDMIINQLILLKIAA